MSSNPKSRMLKSYLKDILHIASRGDAREESYYTSLKSLIDDFAKSIHREEIHVTILPKKTEAGNPDFRIWQGMQKVIGYMEAKNPKENLDDIVESEQIKRYLDGFPNFILTNFFKFQIYRQGKKIDIASLAQESQYAGEVKRKTPILVILGNPPYSGHSYNWGEWISKEIKEYYKVDGKPLGEKNPKMLQDDYVKFVRFAQWKIEQAGEGVLGFITNHSYLDNLTFRGMRQSLMNSFDEIYILDLHGSSLKKEKCPDGSKDENVFDIRQGVAISLFIKKKNVGAL